MKDPLHLTSKPLRLSLTPIFLTGLALIRLSHRGLALKTACLLGALLLSACSTLYNPPSSQTPTQQLDWQETSRLLNETTNWKIVAKIGIRTPDDSFTAAVNQWTQAESSFVIDLSSTFFGLGASKLFGTPEYLTIVESGESPVSSYEPDLLIAEALGFPLPISMLPWWLKGLPSPDSEYTIEFNELGLPLNIEQDNWQLTYSKHHFVKGLPLPGKVKLERDNVRIILAIKQWTLL